MPLQLINPWPVDGALVAYERQFVPEDVEIVGLKEGFRGSRSNVERNLSALFDAVIDAERKGCDAVVVACFSDPGIEAARELVGIPVIGPFNAGLHISQVIGRRGLVLVTDAARIGRSMMRDLAAVYGLETRVVVRGTDKSVPEALLEYRDYKTTGLISPFIGDMIDMCVTSVREDDLDSIIIGCGGLMWMKDIIEKELNARDCGTPVINPLTVAIEVARSLAGLKLSHRCHK
jgi:allantoin racemase